MDSDEEQLPWLPHYVTVGQLKEMLADLPDEAQLHPNLVRNLAIVENNHFTGMINCLHTENCKPYLERWE